MKEITNIIYKNNMKEIINIIYNNNMTEINKIEIKYDCNQQGWGEEVSYIFYF